MIPHPDTTHAAQAAYSVAPNGVGTGQVSQSAPFQAGKRDDGTIEFQKPSKLVDHQFDYARNEKQISDKKMGFTDLTEQRNKDLAAEVNTDSQSMNDRRKNNIKLGMDAIVRHDLPDLDKQIGYFLQSDGDPKDLINGLETAAMQMHVSRNALAAIKSNPSITDLKKLQAIRQLVGEIR